MICQNDGNLLAAQAVLVPGQSNRRHIRLLWIDGKSGKQLAKTDLRKLEDERPRLGPMIVHGKSVWTFFGRGHDDPNRDFVELQQTGNADAVSTPLDTWAPWANASEDVRSAAQKVGIHWNVVAGYNGQPQSFFESYHGKDKVLGIEVKSGQPAIFAQRLTIPETRPRLKMQVGHPDGVDWRLQVKVNEEIVWDELLSEKFPKETWSDLEIDLSGFRGKSAWLSVSARPKSGSETVTTLWRSLELVQ